MSKQYRDKKRHTGVQAVHKHRNTHKLDDVLPLDQLRDEVLNRCGNI